VALLLVPRILVALISTGGDVAAPGEGLLWSGLALLVIPTSAILGANLAYRTPAPGTEPPWYAQTDAVLLLFWLPGGVGAYLLSYWFSVQPQPDLGFHWARWSLVGVILALGAWIAGGVAYLVASTRADPSQLLRTVRTARDKHSRLSFLGILAAAVAAGALGGVLFYWFTALLEQIQNIVVYGRNLAR
jgi:hypothetical protein